MERPQGLEITGRLEQQPGATGLKVIKAPGNPLVYLLCTERRSLTVGRPAEDPESAARSMTRDTSGQGRREGPKEA